MSIYLKTYELRRVVLDILTQYVFAIWAAQTIILSWKRPRTQDKVAIVCNQVELHLMFQCR